MQDSNNIIQQKELLLNNPKQIGAVWKSFQTAPIIISE